MSESYFKKKLEPIKVKQKSISQLLSEMRKPLTKGANSAKRLMSGKTCLKKKI